MKSLFFFLLCFASCWAQKPEYAVSAIPAELTENANAVVRFESINITISSRTSVNVKTFRVVTILNEAGLSHIDAYEYKPVKSVGAVVYDASGKEIKTLRRKDFREANVADAAEITDNKITYLEFTPTSFPFTIAYESEVGDSNTGLLPGWRPLAATAESVEKAVVTVSCPANLGLKYKELNLGQGITKEATATGVRFTAQKLIARKDEQYAPPLRKTIPQVIFALERFSLEGVDGEATSWQDFGKWMQKSLLTGTTALPPEARNQIVALVGNETDPMKKAKIVYEYVQSRTRYVSIQLGIGGWKPMKAADVHRLGYGDCKALTNYTKSLLEAVGVPSYYCVIDAGYSKSDLSEDFVSMQGNHVTLAIPDGDKLRWAECTSQTAPFDFQANFTDDRMALVLKPDGGQLMRTHVYSGNDNSKFSRGSYAIGADGQISGNLEIKTKGTRYGARQMLSSQSVTERTMHYKEYFGLINNLALGKVEVINDKTSPECIEKLEMTAPGYASVSGARIIFAPNAFNQDSDVPQRYRNRTNPVEVDRGFYDEDEFTIAIPEGFSVEARPQDVEFTDAFGKYKAEIKMIDANHMLYKRSLLINQGNYPAADYEKFRKFREQIAKADNAKCVLVKT